MTPNVPQAQASVAEELARLGNQLACISGIVKGLSLRLEDELANAAFDVPKVKIVDVGEERRVVSPSRQARVRRPHRRSNMSGSSGSLSGDWPDSDRNEDESSIGLPSKVDLFLNSASPTRGRPLGASKVAAFVSDQEWNPPRPPALPSTPPLPEADLDLDANLPGSSDADHQVLSPLAEAPVRLVPHGRHVGQLVFAAKGSVAFDRPAAATYRRSSTVKSLVPKSEESGGSFLDTLDPATVWRSNDCEYGGGRGARRLSWVPTIHPEAYGFAAWQFLGGMFLCYDIATMPLYTAFDDFPENDFWAAIANAIVLYWSIDLILNFFLGFDAADATVVMDPRATAKHYFFGQFFFDAIVVGCDYIALAADGVWGSSRPGRTTRLLRTARALLRGRKLRVMFEKLMDRIKSEEVFFAIKVTLLLAASLVVVHYTACYWHLVGNTFGGWLQQAGLESSSFGSRYAASVHWALAQSGLASVDTVPVNSWERSYACCISVMWLGMLPIIISFVCAWLMNLQESMRERSIEQQRLRKYLNTHKVTTKLSNSILRFYRNNNQNSLARLQESDVAFLRFLPQDMVARLRVEINLPVLLSHPVFHLLSEAGPLRRRSVIWASEEGLRGRIYYPDEEVFSQGSVATHTYFVSTGYLAYWRLLREDSRTPSKDSEEKPANVASPRSPKMAWESCQAHLNSGDIVSEALLWMPWEHVGSCKALGMCEIMLLSPQPVAQLLKDSEQLRAYREAVQRNFPRHDAPGASDVWDMGKIRPLARVAFGLEAAPATPRNDVLARDMSPSFHLRSFGLGSWRQP